MNKQEEIERYLDEVLEEVADEFYVDANPIPSIRKRILRYLHSQGVVKKVDTDNWVDHTVTITEGLNSATFPARLLKDAGYEATEPLVEE